MVARSTQHVDQLLTNVSVNYKPQGFVFDAAAPKVPVKKQTDLYRTYTRNFRIPETKRANKGLAREFQFEVGTSSYVLETHALKDYVSDQDEDNYDLASLKADVTEKLTQALMLRKEKSLVDLMTSTSWSLNVSLAATGAFNSNTTTSNPIPVFDTAATTVINNSGFAPNFAIIPRDSFVAIKNHVSVLERTKYTSKEMTAEMMKGLFDLSEILVPTVAYDSAAEGVTSSISQLWPAHCFVGYKPAKAGPMEPSSMYTFERPSAGVKRWRVEEREADAIEVQSNYQVKVVASLSGYLIKATVQ